MAFIVSLGIGLFQCYREVCAFSFNFKNRLRSAIGWVGWSDYLRVYAW